MPMAEENISWGGEEKLIQNNFPFLTILASWGRKMLLSPDIKNIHWIKQVP